MTTKDAETRFDKIARDTVVSLATNVSNWDLMTLLLSDLTTALTLVDEAVDSLPFWVDDTLRVHDLPEVVRANLLMLKAAALDLENAMIEEEGR